MTGSYRADDGVRLAYRDEESGPPVLLIHGFPVTGAMWEPQVEALRATHRVIVPDLRGHGASEAPPAAAYPMERFARDLLQLLDACGVSEAVVAGLSMGGYVAFALWRQERRRVRALVLADTRAVADTPEAAAGRLKLAARVRTEGVGAVVDGMLPKLLSAATRERDPGLERRIETMMRACPPAGVAAALEGLAGRPDCRDLLPGIGVETLVIVGAEDTVTPPADSEAMARALPKAELVVLPGAGHVSNLEQPESFNHALIGLLARTR